MSTNENGITLTEFMELPKIKGSKWDKALRLYNPDLTFVEDATNWLLENLRSKDIEWFQGIGHQTGIAKKQILDFRDNPQKYVISPKLLETLGALFGKTTQSFFIRPDLNNLNEDTKKCFIEGSKADCFCAPHAPEGMAFGMYTYLLASDILNCYADYKEIEEGKIAIGMEINRTALYNDQE